MKNASLYFASVFTASINPQQVRRTEQAQLRQTTASKLNTPVIGPGGVLMTLRDALSYDLV